MTDNPDEKLATFVQLLAQRLGRLPTEDEVIQFLMGNSEMQAEVLKRRKVTNV